MIAIVWIPGYTTSYTRHTDNQVQRSIDAQAGKHKRTYYARLLASSYREQREQLRVKNREGDTPRCQYTEGAYIQRIHSTIKNCKFLQDY